jgi:membrane-bound lytic murein transglycosylase B
MARMNKLLVFLLVFLGFMASAHAAPLRTRDQVEWLQQLQQEAIGKGIAPEVVHAALDDFVPNPLVISLDQKQPESKISFETYRRNVLSPSRIKKGAELLSLYEDDLNQIAARTGVPPRVVVALWAIESSYGKNMGDFEIVKSLATLAYEGRRAEFFRAQLFDALRILENEKMTSDQLRGSWAGAMGQCQFMPSVFLKHAVDLDQDGHRDIWDSDRDVMASIANYLAAEGWQRDLGWGEELDSSAPADPAILRPDGDEGPSFMVTDNFQALMRWNRSRYFALSVGLLADAFKESHP